MGLSVLPDDPAYLISPIVYFELCMYFEVSREDCKNLVNDSMEELSSEYLQDLHQEMQQAADKEVASDENNETNESVSSSGIKKIFCILNKSQEFVKKFF